MKRTQQQNKALWKWFTIVANGLNDADKPMSKDLMEELYSRPIEIPWTKEMIHDFIWIPLQKAMTDTDSTTELEKIDLNGIYETMCRVLAKRIGYAAPEFPSDENEP